MTDKDHQHIERLQQFHAERGYIVVASKQIQPVGKRIEIDGCSKDLELNRMAVWRVIGYTTRTEFESCMGEVLEAPERWPYFHRIEAAAD